MSWPYKASTEEQTGRQPLPVSQELFLLPMPFLQLIFLVLTSTVPWNSLLRDRNLAEWTNGVSPVSTADAAIPTAYVFMFSSI